MSTDELRRRFPEIPQDLCSDPALGEFAAVFDKPLRLAREPSPCATGHDAANHVYRKLVAPLAIYGLGLATREGVLAEVRGLLEAQRRDPAGFAATLVPEDAAAHEVRGPGCGADPA